MKTIFFILLISIISLALYPKDFITLSQGIHYEDKIKHIMAFFTLSYFFYSGFKDFENNFKFFTLVVIALVIEVLQGYVGREPSVVDFIASIVGILTYLLIKKVILENKKIA